jgi:uncharacterized protein
MSRLLRISIVVSFLSIAAALLPVRSQMTQRSASDRAAVMQAIMLSGGADGFANLGGTLTRIYISGLHAQRPQIPKATLDQIAASVEAFVSKEQKATDLEGQLVSVYERHLSADDIAKMAAFFGSPAGQHYRAAMPAILHESTALGKQWAESITPGVQAEIARHVQETPQ